MASLALAEIFKSIEGETSYAGRPCAFVRTVGCNLRCEWCDTAYAQDGEGIRLSTEEVLAEVERFGTDLVCITGGEPLVQADGVVELCEELLERGHTVLLETNGTMDLSPVPEGVIRIMDVKCPSSGESGKLLPSNLSHLRPKDEVKFVIADRADFDWAVAFIAERGVAGGVEILFAPVAGRLEARALAEWILDAGLEVRLQLQFHKLLWPEQDRGR
jgi:7-carboxy-7-deazaguanine synthase